MTDDTGDVVSAPDSIQLRCGAASRGAALVRSLVDAIVVHDALDEDAATDLRRTPRNPSGA